MPDLLSVCRWRVLAGAALLGAAACSTLPEDPPEPQPATYANGVFVLNRGTEGQPDGSLSYLDRLNRLTADAYRTANNNPLNDNLYAAQLFNGRLYLVLGLSNRVVAAQAVTLQRTEEVIDGLANPRDILFVADTAAYVAEQHNAAAANPTGRIRVYNGGSLSPVAQAVNLDILPERLLRVRDEVLVLPAAGGGTAIERIRIAGRQRQPAWNFASRPNSAAVDANGRLWVLTDASQLIRWNVASGSAEATLSLPNVASGQPGLLTTDAGRTSLYFRYGQQVLRLPIGASSIADTVTVVARNFQALAVDPVSGRLLATVAPQDGSAGRLLRYNLGRRAQGAAVDGALQDSFTVGVNPLGILFTGN